MLLKEKPGKGTVGVVPIGALGSIAGRKGSKKKKIQGLNQGEPPHARSNQRAREPSFKPKKKFPGRGITKQKKAKKNCTTGNFDRNGTREKARRQQKKQW